MDLRLFPQAWEARLLAPDTVQVGYQTLGWQPAKMQTRNEMAGYRGWKVNKARRELIAKHQIFEMKKKIESREESKGRKQRRQVLKLTFGFV